MSTRTIDWGNQRDDYERKYDYDKHLGSGFKEDHLEYQNKRSSILSQKSKYQDSVSAYPRSLINGNDSFLKTLDSYRPKGTNIALASDIANDIDNLSNHLANVFTGFNSYSENKKQVHQDNYDFSEVYANYEKKAAKHYPMSVMEIIPQPEPLNPKDIKGGFENKASDSIHVAYPKIMHVSKKHSHANVANDASYYEQRNTINLESKGIQVNLSPEARPKTQTKSIQSVIESKKSMIESRSRKPKDSLPSNIGSVLNESQETIEEIIQPLQSNRRQSHQRQTPSIEIPMKHRERSLQPKINQEIEKPQNVNAKQVSRKENSYIEKRGPLPDNLSPILPVLPNLAKDLSTKDFSKLDVKPIRLDFQKGPEAEVPAKLNISVNKPYQNSHSKQQNPVPEIVKTETIKNTDTTGISLTQTKPRSSNPYQLIENYYSNLYSKTKESDIKRNVRELYSNRPKHVYVEGIDQEVHRKSTKTQGNNQLSIQEKYTTPNFTEKTKRVNTPMNNTDEIESAMAILIKKSQNNVF